MTIQEYTLEEISYSRKEDCRIMESVLLKWFKNPKVLNFVSPKLSYPFQFKKWISKFYANSEQNTKTIILKNKKWIIGHISLEFENGKSNFFHLFIDKEYRGKSLGEKLIQEMETISTHYNIPKITTSIASKNNIAEKLLIKRGYQKSDTTKTGLIKLYKNLMIINN